MAENIREWGLLIRRFRTHVLSDAQNPVCEGEKDTDTINHLLS